MAAPLAAHTLIDRFGRFHASAAGTRHTTREQAMAGTSDKVGGEFEKADRAGVMLQAANKALIDISIRVTLKAPDEKKPGESLTKQKKQGIRRGRRQVLKACWRPRSTHRGSRRSTARIGLRPGRTAPCAARCRSTMA
ncbi:MAG: hypothetical protein ACREXI_11640, partial [Caldimonas sp.]